MWATDTHQLVMHPEEKGTQGLLGITLTVPRNPNPASDVNKLNNFRSI